MELRHLRYFVAVAEELHFGRAAARLHVAQSALSQQIKRLEAKLGVELLTRTKRHVALTEPGRLFLVEARRTLAQARQAVAVAQRAAAGEEGRLRIGYVDAALWGVLPGILRAYRTAHPAVELTLVERLPAQQVAGLGAGRLDVGIGPPPQSDELESVLIAEEPLVAALPAGHRLASSAAVDLPELASDPWVLLPATVRSPLRETVIAACAAAGVTPQVRQVARQLDVVIALVSAGLGVTLAPRSAERVSREGVVFRSLRGVDARFRLAAGWRRTDASPAVASFLAVVRREVPQADG